MKIAVVGAGAMGGIFGVALSAAGHDVVMIDVAEPLVDRITSEGLTVVSPDGKQRSLRVPATTNPEKVGPVDAVAFFVKCYHTEAAATSARPLVGPDTTVVSLQNGWGNGEVLERHFGDDRLVLGVTYNSGTALEPGRIAHTNLDTTTIGSYRATPLERAQSFAEALHSAGFECEVAADIETEIWKKLMLNSAALPVAALTGMTAGELGTPGPILDLIDAIALEGIAVARAAGYELDADERIEAINTLLARGGSGKASMLQDFEAGRLSEVEVINGAVVRKADELGMPAPLNRAMAALVRGVEQVRGLR